MKSLEVNGIVLHVGDVIQPALHREGYDALEEPEWKIVAFERFDELIAIRVKRRVGNSFQASLIGTRGEDWFRTFRVVETK